MTGNERAVDSGSPRHIWTTDNNSSSSAVSTSKGSDDHMREQARPYEDATYGVFGVMGDKSPMLGIQPLTFIGYLHALLWFRGKLIYISLPNMTSLHHRLVAPKGMALILDFLAALL